MDQDLRGVRAADTSEGSKRMQLHYRAAMKGVTDMKHHADTKCLTFSTCISHPFFAQPTPIAYPRGLGDGRVACPWEGTGRSSVNLKLVPSVRLVVNAMLMNV